MLIIKDIVWINKNINEALVVITDGQNHIRCFSIDYEIHIGGKFNGILMAIDMNNVVRSDSSIDYIFQGNDAFECEVQGRLRNGRKTLLVGMIEIDVSACYIPNDIIDGEYIIAKIPRIDIIV